MSGRGRRRGQRGQQRKEQRKRRRHSKKPVRHAARERPPVHASRTHRVPPMRNRWVERWHKDQRLRRRLQMKLQLEWRLRMERRAAQRLTQQLRERQETLPLPQQQRMLTQHQHQHSRHHSSLQSPQQRKQTLRVKEFAYIVAGSFVLSLAPLDRRRVFDAASVIGSAVAPTMVAAVVVAAVVRSWLAAGCDRRGESEAEVSAAMSSLRRCFNRCKCTRQMLWSASLLTDLPADSVGVALVTALERRNERVRQSRAHSRVDCSPQLLSFSCTPTRPLTSRYRFTCD